MYKISWSKDEAKVIGRIDRYGLIVLGFFILFELNRNLVAGFIAPTEVISTISFALITGTLYGRILGTSRRILKTLHREGLFVPHHRSSSKS